MPRSVHRPCQPNPRQKAAVSRDRVGRDETDATIAEPLGTGHHGGKVGLYAAPLLDLDGDRAVEPERLQLASGGTPHGPLRGFLDQAPGAVRVKR